MACMPRAARDSLGGYCYHVLNRGNARRTVFHKDSDYEAFVRLLREAGERVDGEFKGGIQRGQVTFLKGFP